MTQKPLQSAQTIQYIDDLLYVLNQQNTTKSSNEDIDNKENIYDSILPLLPIFRSKSLQNDTILLESRHYPFQSIQSLPPKPIKRNISDDIAISTASQKETYKVRCCRVEDSEYIFKLLHETWPDEFDTRNTKYWTKQFLENNEIYGFAIEQIITSNNHKQNATYTEVKTDEIKINSTNNISNHNITKNIVGISLYQWNTPDDFTWQDTDFPLNVQSDFTDPKYKTKQFRNIINKQKKAQHNKVRNNLNLEKHFTKLHTHFIHFTDIAIDPNHRNKGLGTQLMQAIIYSFPSNTKYGLEVETLNIGAIKCYENVGFTIIRRVIDYYGYDKDAYKMTMVSDYNQNDIEQFFERCVKKQKQNVSKMMQDSINKLSGKQFVENESKNDFVSGYDFRLQSVTPPTQLPSITPPPSLVDKCNNIFDGYNDGIVGGYNSRSDARSDAPSLGNMCEYDSKDMENIGVYDSKEDCGYDMNSMEIVKKYIYDDDDENEMYMENLLIQLGLSAFIQDFKDYGINKNNLMTLSVDVLQFVIPIEDLRVKFEKWLVNYRNNGFESETNDENDMVSITVLSD